MGFLDSKEEMLKIVLTDHGKKKLAEGDLQVAHYAFFDDEVDYEVNSGYITGAIIPIQDPLQIFGNNLTRWWRGDSNVTLSGAGDTGFVSSWTDKVVLEAADATSTEEPFTSSLADQSAINFSGTNDSDGLNVPSSSGRYNYLHNGSGSLVAVVFKATRIATEYMFDNARADPARVGLSCVSVQGIGGVGFRVCNGTGTYSIHASASYNPSENNWAMFINGEDYSPNTKLFLNTLSSSAYEHDYDAAPVGDDSTHSLMIGSRNSSNSNFPIKGEIAELIFVEGLPSDDQLQQLSRYFTDRYKI